MGAGEEPDLQLLGAHAPALSVFRVGGGGVAEHGRDLGRGKDQLAGGGSLPFPGLVEPHAGPHQQHQHHHAQENAGEQMLSGEGGVGGTCRLGLVRRCFTLGSLPHGWPSFPDGRDPSEFQCSKGLLQTPPGFREAFVKEFRVSLTNRSAPIFYLLYRL